MAQRLAKGKGIRVRVTVPGWNEEGEIVRSYRRGGKKEYEIRLGPSHFIYLERSQFEIIDTVIPFRTLARLRDLGPG